MDTEAIKPVTPGAYEEYDLANTGYVTYRQTVRFNAVGQLPFYKIITDPEGWS